MKFVEVSWNPQFNVSVMNFSFMLHCHKAFWRSLKVIKAACDNCLYLSFLLYTECLIRYYKIKEKWAKLWWKCEWHASVQLEISFGCKTLLHYYFIAFWTRLCFPLQKTKLITSTLKLRVSDMNNQNNLKGSLSSNIFESLTSKTYSVEQHAVWWNA